MTRRLIFGRRRHQRQRRYHPVKTMKIIKPKSFHSFLENECIIMLFRVILFA